MSLMFSFSVYISFQFVIFFMIFFSYFRYFDGSVIKSVFFVKLVAPSVETRSLSLSFKFPKTIQEVY
jgi:hypothetical protein